MSALFNKETLKNLESIGDVLDELDPEKKFSTYASLRELAFCFIPSIIQDKSLFKLMVYEYGRFLAEIMVVDKALSNNLYHYVTIKLDDEISNEEKTYLLENIDHYIKPRENKLNPDINRFGAGCLTYKLSYEQALTSKDEARCLSAFLFNLSETEIRNCTKQFEKAYNTHTQNDDLFSWYKKQATNGILFMRIADILEKRKDTVESFFQKYQSASSKKTDATQKTHDAYISIRTEAFETIKPYIAPNGEILKLRPGLSKLAQTYDTKPSSEINETELFKLYGFIDHDRLKSSFTDTL